MENRRFPRLSHRADIFFRDERLGENFNAGSACNISAGGIAFHCELPPALHVTVDLVMLNRNVKVKGIVRHKHPVKDERHLVGVAFDNEEWEVMDVMVETGGR